MLDPESSGALLAALRATTDLELEFHGHDDLGLATANTLAAVKAGATHASVTVIGIGERAGNAPLDEVVMAARLTLRTDCGVKTRQLSALGDLVAHAAQRPLAPEKPVTGTAVFRHESGIHCSGLLQNRATYEPFAAEDVGHAPTEMVVGRHSGTRLLREKLAPMKLNFPPVLLPALLAAVRQFSAVRKRNVTDAELRNLADQLKQNHGLPDL